jgi:hypothetical protein
MRVAVHETIAKADGVVFHCSLSGLDADRWLEVPAWMFDRAACPDQPRLATSPFVGMSALSTLSDLIHQALGGLSASSDTPLSDASVSSHDQNRGEAHDRADIVATVSNTGRGSKVSAKRRRSADRSVRRRAIDIADEDAGVAGVARGDQKHTHQPTGAIVSGTRAGKRRRLADGGQP